MILLKSGGGHRLKPEIARFGAWLSLVERLVRDQEAGGSNPLAPTTYLSRFEIPTADLSNSAELICIAIVPSFVPILGGARPFHSRAPSAPGDVRTAAVVEKSLCPAR